MTSDSIFAWLTRHPFVLVAALGATASSIIHIIDLTARVVRWWRHSQTEPLDRYIPGHDEWIYVTNHRYGFKFGYPRSWLRETSGSTDGHTVRHPATPKIEIRGWGGFAVVWETLDEWIEASTSGKGIRVVSRTEADVEIHAPDPTRLDGFRLVYDEGAMRKMQVFAQDEGRQVSVLCTAPRRDFVRYESTFWTACNSLVLVDFVDSPWQTGEPATGEAMTRTRTEQIWAELQGEGRHYTVKLVLTVKELMGGKDVPVDRAVARTELTPMSGMAVEDGHYTLRYDFNGKTTEDQVRVEDGTLLAG